MKAPIFSLLLVGGVAGGVGVGDVAAQAVVATGTIGVSAGGVLLDGDQPAFQQRFRQRKDAVAGLEEFSVTRADDTSMLRFEARVIPGNEDYRVGLRWEKFDVLYVEATYQRFRTYYDGSGGRLLPRDLAFSYFDENLGLDRSFLAIEVGSLVPDRANWKLRYERLTREGEKNSIRWGDSNLGGAGLSPRAFVPSYYLLDEVRDIVSAELSRRTDETHWKVAGRYERTKLDNRHLARRRPAEPQDRYVTSRDGADVDLFSGHGYYERVFNEKLRWSAGGLITTIESDVFGSKIYGDRPNADYSPTFARRQAGDVGYLGLVGNAEMRQYIGNFNVVYQPVKFWTIRPGLKYEHLRQEAGEQHTDTDFGGGAAAAAIQRQMEAASRNSWNEITEEIEARYTRWADLPLSFRAQWNQGTGNLVEESILLTSGARLLDRETEYERVGQRYTASASWYVRPGLTLAASYNYRLKMADYEHRRDSTANRTGFDRYPAYIVDNDIASHDANIRLSWRPRSMLSFVTRYAHMRTTLVTSMDGPGEVTNGKLTRHIVTQTATWQPLARLYLMGAFNITYDQLWVPAHRLTFPSDNNYLSASLGAGYALGKATDLFLDVTHYRADNVIDNPAVTLPLNSGASQQSGFLTWVWRSSEHLIYTAKYGYARNRDGMFGGQNDFDAHLLHAKVQYRF